MALLNLPATHLQRRRQPSLRLVYSLGFPKTGRQCCHFHVDLYDDTTFRSVLICGGSPKNSTHGGSTSSSRETTCSLEGGYRCSESLRFRVLPDNLIPNAEEKDANLTATTSLFGFSNDGEKKDGVPTGISTYGNQWLNVGRGAFAKPEEKKDTCAGERTAFFPSFLWLTRCQPVPLPPQMTNPESQDPRSL